MNVKLKNKINKCVVKIIADSINVNWNLPYLKETPDNGQGTGFFIDNKGHILTCAHVIDGAKNVYIELPNINNQKYDCEVIGICPEFDIGMLYCKTYQPKDYVTLGDSDKLKIESKVQVVGYPLSLRKENNANNLKFTVGIIGGQQSGFIQTDSAINPGNSGGPLFNNGKVIGINSMKLVGKNLDNIGFSIPINYFKTIKDDLMNNKMRSIIYRPDLLFQYDNTDKEVLKKITNGKITDGIKISKIFKPSPLKNIIDENNIITEINGYKLDNFGYTLNYKWLGSSIKIETLIDRFKNNSNIVIKYFDLKSMKMKQNKILLKPYIYPIRVLYPAYENIGYLVFGGMVFTELSKNYIINLDNEIFNTNYKLINIIKNKEEQMSPSLCITEIFNTKIKKLNNIKKCNIITKVNDIEVNNINDLTKALSKPITINKSQFIKIENNENKSIIMSIKDLYEQDKSFSNNYSYNISNLYDKLLHK